MLLLHLSILLPRFIWEYIRQIQFVRRHISPHLQPYLEGEQATFTRAEAHRIQFYASLIPTLAAASYALLAKINLSVQERMLISKLSAATPLVDDYFDDPKLSSERLKGLISAPETCVPQGQREALLLRLLCDIRSETRQSESFNTLSLKVFEAQLASKRQQNGDLSYAEIKKIMFDKGGYSTLLYHNLVEHPPVPGTEEALYHLGGMVQWVDDLFDVYEDTQDGIQTLVSKNSDIETLRMDFEKETANLLHRFEALALPKQQIRRYWTLMRVFFALALVCLDQLQAVQQRQGGIFRPHTCSRQELICDMARFQNLWKWFRYVLFGLHSR